MIDWVAAAALIVFAATPPAERADRPADGSPLGQAIAGIWKDAEVGSDEAFQKLNAQVKSPAICPRDLREVVIASPEPRQVRGWPSTLNVSFDDDLLMLFWRGEVAVGVEAKAAQQQFVKTLEERGYKAVGAPEVKTFEQHVDPNVNGPREVFMRSAGETELWASGMASDYTGGNGTIKCGVNFTWLAQRAWSKPRPTLHEALAALPMMKASYLDEKFYAALADLPVGVLRSGGLSIQFARPLTKAQTEQVVQALEANGYEFQKEWDPSRDGTYIKWWSRFADRASANMTFAADGALLGLYCQPPSHTGPPLKKRPPEQHPSTRLPRSKRPTVALDQLPITNPEVVRALDLFVALVEETAGKGWKLPPFSDQRWSSEPIYLTGWGSRANYSSSYLASMRPYRRIGLQLNGQHVEGADRLTLLTIAGVQVPADGWAAYVNFGFGERGGDRRLVSTLRATIALARGGQSFAFDSSFQQAQRLTAQSVRAQHRETNIFQYEFEVGLPEDTYEESLQKLYGTPEEFRDAVLADLGALRELARKNIESSEGMKVWDFTGVRSDNPPRDSPATSRPPNAETKAALLTTVEADLAAREKLVRAEFRAMHAALEHALPLAKVQDQLPVPAEAK